MTIPEIIRSVQARLGLRVDGAAGPETWGAIHRAIVGAAKPPGSDKSDRSDKSDPSDTAAIPPVDPRSERTIATLHPRVHPMARALVQAAAVQGIIVRIISGLRTYEEQAALYAKGRTAPGRIVTKAGPGYSNHNFGLAFDVGIFQGGKYLEESPLYKVVGALGRGLGLEWGGDWKSIIDEPHFQLRPAWAARMSERDMLAELRRRRAAGIDAFA